MTKAIEDLTRGDRILLPNRTKPVTFLGTSLPNDPDRIRVAYAHGPNSWQRTTTTVRRGTRLEVVA